MDSEEATPCLMVQASEVFGSLGVNFPETKLDYSLCGPGCMLEDEMTLINHFEYNPRGKKSLLRYTFCGTRAIEPLWGLAYWQVAIYGVPQKPMVIPQGTSLCEVGVATPDALQIISAITPTTKGAATLKMYIENMHVVVKINCNEKKRHEAVLAVFDPARPIDQKFGFLFNTANGNMLIFNVKRRKIMDAFTMAFTGPLFPVVNVVHPARYIGADISVTMDSGPKLSMPESLAAFVKEMVQAIVETKRQETKKKPEPAAAAKKAEKVVDMKKVREEALKGLRKGMRIKKVVRTDRVKEEKDAKVRKTEK